MLAVLRNTVPAALRARHPDRGRHGHVLHAGVAVERRRRDQAARPFGLRNLDALRAATTTAAALLGRDREIGRLKPGYAADAVVVGGNPLDNLAALDDMRIVIARGWIVRGG